MAINSMMTPSFYAKVWTSITLVDNHGVGETGTYNAILCNASTGSVLSGRWYFRTHVSAAGAAGRLATTYDFSLPDDYINGTDIKIVPIQTSSELLAKATVWNIGLTRLNSLTLGSDTQTEWKIITTTGSSIIGNFLSQKMTGITYSGVNLSRSKPMNLIIFRDSPNAADTSVASVYTAMIEIQYQRDSYATQSFGPINKIMTPNTNRTLYREVFMSPSIIDSGITAAINGISTSTCPVGVINGRWSGRVMDEVTSRAACVSWVVPPDYKPGGIIKVKATVYGTLSTTGSCDTYMGLSTDTIGAAFGDDTKTEFINKLIVMSGYSYQTQDVVYTFSGVNKSLVNINSGDPIAFSFIRNVFALTSSNADTYNGGLVLGGFNIYYQVDDMGSII